MYCKVTMEDRTFLSQDLLPAFFTQQWAMSKKYFIIYFLNSFKDLFWPQGWVSTLICSTLLHNDPAAHQDHCGRCRIRTRTSAPEVWCATNEPKYWPFPIFLINNAHWYHIWSRYSTVECWWVSVKKCARFTLFYFLLLNYNSFTFGYSWSSPLPPKS